MCGIAGFLMDPLPRESPEAILDMLSAINHRGPDESGYVLLPKVAMSTARLQILDFENGQQPILSEDRRYCLAYNGEIYNYIELREELKAIGHSFKTNCDTEVVIKAWEEWGEESLLRLNGGFAFSLFDQLEDTLFLARDRFGKRPLYYYQDSEKFVYASEIKGISSFPGINLKINADSLAMIFAFWTPFESITPYEKVYQVPPGHYLKLNSKGSDPKQYFKLSFDGAAEEINSGKAAEKVKHAIDRSVYSRLRSDTEVGAYLSGGLDSAIVTQEAREYVSKIKSFSVTFEDPSFDESNEQKELSKYLGTDHHPLRITGSDIVDVFPQAVMHAEVPVFRTAFVPMYLLSRHVRNNGIKVVLTGEGADEVFLGYNIFKETLLRKDWRNLQSAERAKVISSLYPYLKHYKDDKSSKMLHALYENFSEEGNPFFSHEIRLFNSSFSLKLLSKDLPIQHVLSKAKQEGLFPDPSETAVQNAQFLEYKTLLHGYLLSTQGDRMTFAHGVEARCPFLDPDLFDLSKSLPQSLKLSSQGVEKTILKTAYKDSLPQFVLDKPKQPYRAPDAKAFLESGSDYLDSVLSEVELGKLDFIDAKFANRLLSKLMKSDTSNISHREDQAFLLLLSTSLIVQSFIKHRPPRQKLNLVRSIDLRNCG